MDLSNRRYDISMGVFELINYIKQSPNNNLLAITRDLLKFKFDCNIIILLDNKDKSKVLGHKIFRSEDQLTQYIVHLPRNCGYVYFNKSNNKYYSGASFFDQGWVCEYDGETIAMTTDYYDENMRSTYAHIIAYQLDLFEVSSDIKVVV